MADGDVFEIQDVLDADTSIEIKLNAILINQRRIMKSMENLTNGLLSLQNDNDNMKASILLLQTSLTDSNVSVDSSKGACQAEVSKSMVTVHYKGKDVPLHLPPSLEWRIAATTTARGIIRLLLLHFHDIKSLLTYTLTGASCSKAESCIGIQALPELTYLYILAVIRNKFKVTQMDNPLEYEKALQSQISSTRIAIGKVLQDIKTNHENDGNRRPTKRKKSSANNDTSSGNGESSIDGQ